MHTHRHISIPIHAPIPVRRKLPQHGYITRAKAEWTLYQWYGLIGWVTHGDAADRTAQNRIWYRHLAADIDISVMRDGAGLAAVPCGRDTWRCLYRSAKDSVICHDTGDNSAISIHCPQTTPYYLGSTQLLHSRYSYGDLIHAWLDGGHAAVQQRLMYAAPHWYPFFSGSCHWDMGGLQLRLSMRLAWCLPYFVA